jgi:hypothetical protein
MAENMSLRLGGGPTKFPVTPTAKPPKVAAEHVDNFSAANLGKKVPIKPRQKIMGQTFLDR